MKNLKLFIRIIKTNFEKKNLSKTFALIKEIQNWSQENMAIYERNNRKMKG